MANSFKIYTSNNVGTVATTIGSHAVATGATETVIGLSISNITTSAISADVQYANNAGSTTYLIKDAPIAYGGSLVVVGGDQKLVLLEGDSIKVTANTATSADVVMSVLEIT
jgi:hypothetical protein